MDWTVMPIPPCVLPEKRAWIRSGAGRGEVPGDVPATAEEEDALPEAEVELVAFSLAVDLVVLDSACVVALLDVEVDDARAALVA